MTVAELIDKLRSMPQDSMVVVLGYEGGYDNPVITSSTLVIDDNWNGKDKKVYYWGRHSDYRDMESDANFCQRDCVVIGREYNGVG